MSNPVTRWFVRRRRWRELNKFFSAMRTGGVDDIASILSKDPSLASEANLFQTTALKRAATLDRANLLPILIENGADINFATADGTTALHHAASYDMVNALVLLGSELEARDRHGFTPLLYAVADEDREKDCIIALLEAGADPNAACKWGRSVMDYAIDSRRGDIVRALRENIALDVRA